MSTFRFLRRAASTLSLALLAVAVTAAGETRFTIVDSSPTSWVARGYDNYTVTPADGWTFSADRNFDNGVGFLIEGDPLPGTAVDYWNLEFAAPFEALITPGLYENFERFPFQDPDRPGLGFTSTGRGDNQAAGFFEVFEATYGPGGEVLSFSADFTHYGETSPSNYAIVQVRYNATIPEPSSLGLLGLAGAAIGLGAARRRSGEVRTPRS